MGMLFIRAGSVLCLLRNEPHALIPSVCGMLVHKELKSVVIIIDSGVIRCLMSLSFLRKSLVSIIKLGILCRRGWRMESTYPELCSVSVIFVDTIGLYGRLMPRLFALSITCVVLIKLLSVMCLFVLVDMRWLSFCSFGKAQNVPGVAFTGNSCEICSLLLDDMLPMMSLASSLCVSIISDVVFWYLLLSVKIRLQSCI